MAGHTWCMWMNLDEFNALALSLASDQDRAFAFQGLASGCNLGQAPGEDAPDPFRRAWEIGARWRNGAEQKRLENGRAGKASAASRKQKLGTAQPARRRAEQVFDGAASPEQVFEECSNGPRTDLEPNHEPEEKIKSGLGQGMLYEMGEPVLAPPEPAPGLGFAPRTPNEVSPIGDLDDFDIPLQPTTRRW